MRKLVLSDIADARAYEREREAFRDRVIASKKIRRVSVGPVVTLVFENRDTIRFQIQEMARAERLYTDEAIQTELDTYNPLIPDAGQLSASLFIELTNRQEMESWLPRLVGIETSARLELGPARPDAGSDANGSAGSDGSAGGVEIVPCEVDEGHAANLTREEMTAAVHFVHFSLTSAQIERFRTGPVAVAFDHPHYRYRAPLAEGTRSSLLEDLLG